MSIPSVRKTKFLFTVLVPRGVMSWTSRRVHQDRRYLPSSPAKSGQHTGHRVYTYLHTRTSATRGSPGVRSCGHLRRSHSRDSRGSRRRYTRCTSAEVTLIEVPSVWEWVRRFTPTRPTKDLQEPSSMSIWYLSTLRPPTLRPQRLKGKGESPT